MPTTAVEAPAERVETARLILRPPVRADAAAIQRLAGAWEVARYTAQIPHPYENGTAEAWIDSLAVERGWRGDVTLAIELRDSGALIGCIGFERDADEGEASIGYWIGRPYWGQGYATEAIGALVGLAFGRLGLHRLTASVVPENHASARTLGKAGFRAAGLETIDAPARGRRLDVDIYALDRTAKTRSPVVPPVVLVVAAALVDADGRVLLARRPAGKAMAGLWEFPGGKVHEGESPESALLRELDEELGLDVSASCLAPLTFASHRYEDFHLLMPLYVCRRWNGTATPREGQELAWVRPSRLPDYPMPPADKPLIAALRDLL